MGREGGGEQRMILNTTKLVTACHAKVTLETACCKDTPWHRLASNQAGVGRGGGTCSVNVLQVHCTKRGSVNTYLPSPQNTRKFDRHRLMGMCEGEGGGVGGGGGTSARTECMPARSPSVFTAISWLAADDRDCLFRIMMASASAMTDMDTMVMAR
jgi:hypothetical protein